MMDFEGILKRLTIGRVDFVIIGGFAMYSRGSSQLTRDLDICYDRSRPNIQRLVSVLAQDHPRLRGAPSDLPFLFDAETIRRGLNFTLTTDFGDLDLLGEVPGIGQYNEAVAQSTTLELFGRACRVLSLEGLIAAKRAAGRPRDLAVIPELEALCELDSLRPKVDARTSGTSQRAKRDLRNRNKSKRR